MIVVQGTATLLASSPMGQAQANMYFETTQACINDVYSTTWVYNSSCPVSLSEF